ncbi:MAG: hypothetical protein QOK38_1395 [Acidobacteriaceae bacterium]|nr:hypothetical protein [Acidobacteriaceae bacterium]
MHKFLALVVTALVLAIPQAPQEASAPVSLTIYNQNFAVARTSVDLALKPGTNEVTTTEVTSQLEPDSVVLRDPTGKHIFSVVEQNYDAAIVSQEWLLQKYEGQTIDFQTNTYVDDKTHVQTPILVQGKILRASPPLVEVDGKMQFQLPGTPLFPATTNGLLLKPTLRWQIASEHAASFPAELSYVTGGFTWSATYNLVASSGTGGSATEPMDLVGWITMQNNCGVDFPAASIQLVAGNVAKIQNEAVAAIGGMGTGNGFTLKAVPAVTQQNFDDFHLYDLNRTTSLHNGETKQVEFLTVNAVPVTRRYEFEPNAGFNIYSGAGGAYMDRTYGLVGDPRVTVVNEFTNSTANHLGIPMPAGRLRLYRRDKSGAVQFAGEATISHTPRNEKIRFVTGDAFDITGKRIQTDFHSNHAGRVIDETFSIELKNQKEQPVIVHVIEHLYRAANWEITQKSADYAKRDSNTIEFPVQVKPESAATITYTVHYTW